MRGDPKQEKVSTRRREGERGERRERSEGVRERRWRKEKGREKKEMKQLESALKLMLVCWFMGPEPSRSQGRFWPAHEQIQSTD